MIQQWLSQEPPEIVVPVPTVVVEPQVVIPTELLERLTPPSPGLVAAADATLIAGGLTLGAAILALIGVFYVQSRTRKNVERQIEAERDKHERSERMAALVAAVEVLEEAKLLVVAYQRASSRGTLEDVKDAESKLNANRQQRLVSATRIRLHGMTASYGKAMRAHLAVDKTKRAVGTDQAAGVGTAMVGAIATAVDAFIAEMSTESVAPPTKAMPQPPKTSPAETVAPDPNSPPPSTVSPTPDPSQAKPQPS